MTKLHFFCRKKELTLKDLWVLVKPTVREVEQDDGVVISADAIILL